MRIVVLHNAVPPDAAPDERDVLDQVEAVTKALKQLGHEGEALPCGLDLETLRQRLAKLRPAAVFNLVESLAGQGRLIHLVPGLLEALGIPFTGCPAEALFLTSNKLLAKERLLAAGLATPPWKRAGRSVEGACGRDLFKQCIVKSLWEDASLGLDDDSVLSFEEEEKIEALLKAREAMGVGPWFAEGFLEGREFNLSILAGPHGPEVLPAAEIRFEDYPEGKPRIVGYRAKWKEESFEYRHTVRSFVFSPGEDTLLKRMSAMALDCWRLLGLRGYARVDFRCDDRGRPWILEVNANPCLSPDAGFAAALARAKIRYETAMGRILEEAMGCSA